MTAHPHANKHSHWLLNCLWLLQIRKSYVPFQHSIHRTHKCSMPLNAMHVKKLNSQLVSRVQVHTADGHNAKYDMYNFFIWNLLSNPQFLKKYLSKYAVSSRDSLLLSLMPCLELTEASELYQALSIRISKQDWAISTQLCTKA